MWTTPSVREKPLPSPRVVAGQTAEVRAQVCVSVCVCGGWGGGGGGTSAFVVTSVFPGINR